MTHALPCLRRRSIAGALLLATLPLAQRPVQAHETRAGDIVIEHAYAVPTPPGARTGGVYFRSLNNTGKSVDRLIAASTPVAASVEFHEMRMDGEVMRMRALKAIDLAPGTQTPMRHGGSLHVMLIGLKQALKEGDRFPVTLEFERGGKKEVMAWVQKPRDAADAAEHAAHALEAGRAEPKP
ncbi:MAG: copper chaperone PCu(A)C [Leptothrix sp. (in: b-proteobacteria)]